MDQSTHPLRQPQPAGTMGPDPDRMKLNVRHGKPVRRGRLFHPVSEHSFSEVPLYVQDYKSAHATSCGDPAPYYAAVSMLQLQQQSRPQEQRSLAAASVRDLILARFAHVRTLYRDIAAIVAAKRFHRDDEKVDSHSDLKRTAAAPPSSVHAYGQAIWEGAPQGLTVDVLNHKRFQGQVAHSSAREVRGLLQVGVHRRQKADANERQNAGVRSWHENALRIWKEKLEREARQRLALLKGQDFEAYLEAIQAQKSCQVSQLLEQTDACLRGLMARIEQRSLDAAKAAQLQSDSAFGAEKAALKESCGAWDRLARAIPAKVHQQPAALQNVALHDYQLDGLCWLVGLHDLQLGGILADDMGLGKTVQVLALVSYLVVERQESGPYLIVVPASVTDHWIEEIKRFCPSLKLAIYRGSLDERTSVWNKQIRKVGAANIVLTTYEFLIGKHDVARLSSIWWHYIIMDEGHRIKNAGCKLHITLRGYKLRHKLLLTGTPLQNDLAELWSLLNFLLPDMFNSAEEFDEWFGQRLSGARVQAQSDSATAPTALLREEEILVITNRLHQVLRPFMLRRLKAVLTQKLPPKIERHIGCPCSAYQRAILSSLEHRAASCVDGQTRGGPGINNLVMELRKTCNDPLSSKLHVPGRDAELSDQCVPACVQLGGKMAVLCACLERLLAADHKVLVFCTMTSTLDSIEEALEWYGWKWSRLDGGTKSDERGVVIKSFTQSDNVPIMLMSLRAGGVGLNLQAADTVIFFDTDWNPQMDLQAQARAHRLGQTRPVLVLRLFIPGSIEDHIMATAARKKDMAEAAITGGFFDGKTDATERHAYLVQLLRDSAAQEAGDKLRDEFSLVQVDNILARSPEEKAQFACLTAAGRGLRLASAEQCCPLISDMNAALAPKVEANEPTGRGVRRKASEMAPGSCAKAAIPAKRRR